MNAWAGYIFRTDGITPSRTLKVTVDSFYNASRIMVGRFYGNVYTKINERVIIDGKFRIKISG